MASEKGLTGRVIVSARGFGGMNGVVSDIQTNGQGIPNKHLIVPEASREGCVIKVFYPLRDLIFLPAQGSDIPVITDLRYGWGASYDPSNPEYAELAEKLRNEGFQI